MCCYDDVSFFFYSILLGYNIYTIHTFYLYSLIGIEILIVQFDGYRKRHTYEEPLPQLSIIRTFQSPQKVPSSYSSKHGSGLTLRFKSTEFGVILTHCSGALRGTVARGAPVTCSGDRPGKQPSGSGSFYAS